ncbi:MAG: hypothetical protein JRI36_08240 [Deltaproteobacteria bacterium]|nr:hypothetical protein [Deltaproteobacteria bacterium]
MLKELKVFLPLAEELKAHKPSLEILNHMAVKDGQLLFTDLENWLSIPVADERNYTLPIELIKEILKSRPAELSITIRKGNQLELRYGRNTVVCHFMDAADYTPPLPKERQRRIGVWTGAMIRRMRKQLRHASRDELKPALQGLWVRQSGARVSSCATDGHSLEYMHSLDPAQEGEISADFEGILPPKCLKILSKLRLARATVVAGPEYIQFRLPHYVQLSSRLIHESYPDFETILNGPMPHELALPKAALAQAVAASLPFANKATRLARLKLQNGTIRLLTRDPERELAFGTEIEHAGHAAKALEIGFNLKLLEKTLASLPGEQILWKYRDEHSAQLFCARDEPGQTNLLMPVRLEED